MYSSSSGLAKNINELQSDILAEKLSNNPYLKYHVLIEKNKQLGTANQTIIGAINEVLRKVQSASNTNKAALVELYNVLGHVGAKPELSAQVLSQAPSLIELVLDLKARIDTGDIGSGGSSSKIKFQKDVFMIDHEPQSVFPLSFKPRPNSIFITVNGIKYNDGFRMDENSNTLIWLFDESAGGFDITESEVIIHYTYDSEE